MWLVAGPPLPLPYLSHLSLSPPGQVPLPLVAKEATEASMSGHGGAVSLYCCRWWLGRPAAVADPLTLNLSLPPIIAPSQVISAVHPSFPSRFSSPLISLLVTSIYISLPACL